MSERTKYALIQVLKALIAWIVVIVLFFLFCLSLWYMIEYFDPIGWIGFGSGAIIFSSLYSWYSEACKVYDEKQGVGK